MIPIFDPKQDIDVTSEVDIYAANALALMKDFGTPATWPPSKDNVEIVKVAEDHVDFNDEEYNSWVDLQESMRRKIYQKFDKTLQPGWAEDRPNPDCFELDPPQYFTSTSILSFVQAHDDQATFSNITNCVPKAYSELLGVEVTSQESFRPRALACLSKHENLQACLHLVHKKIEELLTYATLRQMTTGLKNTFLEVDTPTTVENFGTRFPNDLKRLCEEVWRTVQPFKDDWRILQDNNDEKRARAIRVMIDKTYSEQEEISEARALIKTQAADRTHKAYLQYKANKLEEKAIRNSFTRQPGTSSSNQVGVSFGSKLASSGVLKDGYTLVIPKKLKRKE